MGVFYMVMIHFASIKADNHKDESRKNNTASAVKTEAAEKE